jgi:type VI secretion system protein ImpI
MPSMALTLRIENETSLPDGGPLSVSIRGKRGIDIGRDQYLDWTLPDPTRVISGKHCEIRWHDGAYWLHDISTNGTFLYGADSRLKAPHQLRDGDRFSIGHYIVVAALDRDGADADSTGIVADPAPHYDDLWDPVGEVAPPIDSKQLKAPHDLQPVKPDFLDWAIDVPPSYTPPPSRSTSRQTGASAWETPQDASADDSWAQGAIKPPPPEPEVVAVPSPRRPVWVTGEPNGPWAGAPSPAAAPPSGAAAANGGVAAANVLAAAQALAEASGAAARPSAERTAADRPPAPPSDQGNAAPIAPAGGAHDFVRLVARAAGLPEETLASRDPAELATELGQLMRLVTENMKQLLDARQETKRLARSSNQTMIQALNNNPLKFAPTVEDAMRIMFGPPTRSYLDGRRALAQGFTDLKAHQVKTYSAMQHALKLLLGEFDPDVIANTSTGDRGLAGVVGSRKARLWDIYVTRWQARTQSRQDGMLNAFMDYFAECYDRDGK